ncbi:3'-5' exoribonuclease HELZ2-like [Aplochiton taeniatus]
MTANSTGRPNLAFLFETFDFQLGCSLCSLRENEITYTPKSVKHHCIRELLLARVKGIGIWRPISRRPLFPNPGHYEVCRFFTEGSGCSKHRRRCTFARSHEEAAVWNVEKKHGFERSAFIAFITTSECEAVQNHTVQPDTFSSLAELSLALDLKTVCTVCSVKENEITYMVKTVNHQCSRDMLLAKVCGNSKWRPISHRPGSKQPGRNCRYQVCMFFVEGSGCTKDQEKCTFARSHEEATVWNFEKDQSFPRNTLLTVVSESETEVEQQGKTAENILNDHSGEFLELCKDCFHDSPPKITVKRWNSTCSADKAHTWSPVLVHHFSESGGKEVYNQVRPLPLNCGFEFCGHVQQGMPCWHGHTQCQSAHSEVEMAVWKAEDRGKLIRQDLLQLSQSRLPGPRPHMEIYCKVCLLVLSSQESFFNHCASLEHAQLISEDTTTEWKSRPPPPGTRADFWLCDRPDTCEYGNNCLKAHSVEELEEWMMRSKEEREIRNNIETQGFLSFNDRLLEEYRCSSSEVHIMSEQVDDVSITCDKDLYIEHEQITAKLEWNFQVKTERQLAQVALLKQEPGALFSLGEISPEPCIYSKGQKFHNMDIVYDITVSFKSINPGLYEQWLVLDFDMRPVLLQKLKVKVGPKLFTNLVKEPKFLGPPAESFERWHRGNKFIVPCQTKTEVQEDLLKEYKPHQISFQSKQQIDSQTTLNHQNYKDKMHAFLYNEERAKDQVVSRLNFRGAITLSATLENPQFGMKIAPQGELFCAISVPYTLTPDTSQGFILKRYVQSALIAPVSSVNPNSKAYEAVILHDAISKDNMTDTTSTTSDTAWTPHLNYKMHLQLSKRCCSDLRLQSNAKCEMEVQFQLNRLPFCKMHEAIDQLPDTKAVLPDFSNCAVPVYGANLPDHLNAKQSQAIQYITGNLDVRKPVAPLLIYGPFGTGKTFTLAEAARKLAGQPQNKVLICTHTNR